MNKSKFSHKVISVFLTLNLLVSTIPFNQVFASNNGPGSPEAAGFEPVDATDMVSLSTGDMSYVLPLLSIDGFPINMSYHAGITNDLDASWVGLGWYLNPGAINRSLTNTPDDWKDGIGIDFTSYYDSETYYGITADVGFASTAQVGVGINWGAGKGVSGSVRAMAGFAIGDMVNAGVNASADTNGNVSVGVSAGVSFAGYGAGASYSYSITGKKGSFGIGIGAKMADGSFAGVGASFNSDGYSIGAGVNSINSEGKGAGAGVGMGSASFNSGDMSIDTSTFAIAIPVYFYGISFTIGFSKKKVKYSLRKGFVKHDWGALYANDFSNMTSGNSLANSIDGFNDYQKRTKSFDTYSTRIPQPEQEFIGDYSKDIENINFTYIGYDGYNVNAQGINGFMTPRLFQNTTIFGKGDRTQNAQGDDIHVFWHHGVNNSNNVAQRQFGGGNNQLYFYFDGHLTSRETVIPSSVNSQSNKSAINSYVQGGGLTSNYSTTNPYKRAKTPNYVEVFTNSQIANNNGNYVKSKGLVVPTNEVFSNRDNPALFDPNGIGAYKITSSDGKTYHFSLPVYHFEMVQRSLIDEDETSPGIASNVKEKRQYSKYATHWLLTAVTGSDYIDTNNNGKVDSEDYGYWVELDYGKWSDGFVWRNPHDSSVKNYSTNLLNDVQDGDKGYYQFGRKQIYYLDKIKTRNKTAVFVKNMRYDAVGKALNFALTDGYYPENGYLETTGNNSGMNYTSNIHIGETSVNYKREYSLKLDKIVVLQTEIADQLSKDNSGTLGVNLTNYSRDDVHFPQWQSPDFAAAYGSNYSYGLHNESQVFDVNDVSQSFINQNALKVIEMDYDYSLAKKSDSSSELPANLTQGHQGKLTLNKVYFKGRGGAYYMPPYKFDYYLKNMENLSLKEIRDDHMPNFMSGLNQMLAIRQYVKAKRESIDNWGFLKGKFNGEDRIKAWSLKQITTPTGAKIEVDYEKDDYWIEAFGRRYW
ncbi:MAG: hypothetical protein ACK5M1_03065, partial [Xanthomarina gelatinilytica]|uniref:hypothetical protein n=1 Tax=Xanthomarina gelatinilytica TaxID=1137281 RepID=UPI003A878657